ncbi:MAG TPA: symmetrical bis(5'-nucleosyl)-tetraphosphatase [Thermodesulfobacteriaceae bacterium]|nr:symmetrical bis(5'-nucleosyl)-tetraphosphatase [Thermodesulfobacteriaceae bacterium]
MAIYAIGDVQGYLPPLQHLLDIIKFDPETDEVWFAGDLVNRGPDSLEVLRLIRGLGKCARPVLGNHDLHLLAVASGVKTEKPGDTLAPVLNAPDSEELLDWLRRLPLCHADRSIRTIMVHAGVYVKWSRKKVMRYAEEVQDLLRSDNYADLLKNMYGRKPRRWKKNLTGWERYRFIVNALTRMRFCTSKGKLDFKHKGPPGSQPHKLTPWFRYPGRRCTKWRIIFGHWSTLGYLREGNVISLDSGCLWGKQLTAIRLDCEEERIWQISCDYHSI